MPVNGQLRFAAQRTYPSETNMVQTDHHARPTCLQHELMMATHLIHFVADIDRVHDLASELIRQTIDFCHDKFNAFGQRRMRRVCHQFVVLDEVDSRFAQFAYNLGCLLWRQADTGLNDRADNRAMVDGGKTPGPSNSKLWTRVAFGKHVRYFQV